jgi:hypothetical protein
VAGVDDSTAYAGGDQELMRMSDGCLVVSLSALMNSRGVPSQSPMRQSAATVEGSSVIAIGGRAVVAPAAMLTVRVSTASSFLKIRIVYCPVRMPEQSKWPSSGAAVVQYWAWALRRRRIGCDRIGRSTAASMEQCKSRQGQARRRRTPC